MRLLLIKLALLLPFLAAGSNDNYHIGARSAGMANASVTLYDLWSVHHNQAGLGWLEEFSAGAFYESKFLLNELSVKGGAIAYPTKSGTFGVSIMSFGYSLYSEGKYGLAYGRKLGENVSAGVQVNYLTTRIANDYGNASALSVEAGVQARLSKKLAIGMHLYNPNRAKITDYNNEKIPTVMRLGLDYKFSNKVFTTVEAQKDIDHPAQLKVGIEYHIVEQLYLRAGISSNPFLNTFGFGLKLQKFQVDFATSIHSTLGFTPQMSLTYGIKGPSKKSFAE
jgi:hypothetical protein